jgi:hypothetical protein
MDPGREGAPVTHWWTPADIIERRITGLLVAFPGWEVRQVADLAAILQMQDTGSTVFIAPLGSPGAQSEGNGKVALITQRYAVVFASQGADDLSGQTRREVVGPVIWHVLPRLMGWSPGNGWTTLELVASPSQDYIAEEYAYFPFAFETSIQLFAERA